MKTCIEKCSGTVDMNAPIKVSIGLKVRLTAFPCDKCGRLHWDDGTGTFRGELRGFLEEGIPVLRNAEGQLVTTSQYKARSCEDVL